MYKIIGADQKEYGPITAEQMREWFTQGRVNAQTLVWSETSGNWRPFSSYPEFADLVPAPAPALGAPIPGAPAFAPIPSEPKTNPMAITGLVLGILSLPGFCCCYSLPFSIPAIIFSAVGLAQIKKSPQTQKGQGMAIAGIVLALIGIILGVLLLVGVVMNPEFLKKLEQMGK